MPTPEKKIYIRSNQNEILRKNIIVHVLKIAVKLSCFRGRVSQTRIDVPYAEGGSKEAEVSSRSPVTE